MAGVIPPVHFLTLDALSFLASAAALLLIGWLRPGITSARHGTREPAWQGIARGVRAMRGHPLLGYVLATSGLVNGAWYAVFFLGLPLMIERYGVQGPGGTGLGAYGLVISAYGCTNLASTMFFGSRSLPTRPQFQMFLGTLIVGIGIVLLALASLLPQTWLLWGAVASAAISAVGGPMSDIPIAVLRQSRLARMDVPAAMRATMVVSSIGLLAAMLLAPPLLTGAGLRPVIAACGATLIGVGLVGLLRHGNWVERPQAQEA